MASLDDLKNIYYNEANKNLGPILPEGWTIEPKHHITEALGATDLPQGKTQRLSRKLIGVIKRESTWWEANSGEAEKIPVILISITHRIIKQRRTGPGSVPPPEKSLKYEFIRCIIGSSYSDRHGLRPLRNIKIIEDEDFFRMLK